MSPSIYNFDSEDAQIKFAIEEATNSLQVFFDAYSNPNPNQKGFLLKVQFQDGEKTEHIWMADIDASVFPLEGTIANEPEIGDLKFMQRTTFHPSQITDWMYVEGGYLIGGYTIQAIRSGLSKDERREYDAAAPFKFRD